MSGYSLPGSLTSIDEGVNSVLDQIAEQSHLRNNPVVQACQAIEKYVEEFERSLDGEHEVGVRLASFGGVIIFHAEQIGFSKPNIITFYGTTEEGERVQLIQHVSQLNFLLKSVQKREQKANRIGFVWDIEK